MKYSKRKDKYCCNVLNDNFHEIDERLVDLENNGGGGGGGGTTDVDYSKIEFDTEEIVVENESDTKEILDTLAEIEANTEPEKIAGALAVKELNNNLGGLRFGYDGDSNSYGYYGADDCFIPFSSGGQFEMLEHYTNMLPDDRTSYASSVYPTYKTLATITVTHEKAKKALILFTASIYNGRTGYWQVLVNDEVVAQYNYTGATGTSSQILMIKDFTIDVSQGDVIKLNNANSSSSTYEQLYDVVIYDDNSLTHSSEVSKITPTATSVTVEDSKRVAKFEVEVGRTLWQDMFPVFLGGTPRKLTENNNIPIVYEYDPNEGILTIRASSNVFQTIECDVYYIGYTVV